jgi:hypothetical protein
MYILGFKIFLSSSGVILLFYFVPIKFIIILSFFVKQISSFYFHAVKRGYFIYAAFVSVN